MLLLLKPWRDMKTDLKGADETWEAAFEAFEQSATDAPRPFPFVQLRKCATGGVCGKFESSIQSITNGASS